MTANKAEVVYFTGGSFGKENIEDTLNIAYRRAKELNIKTILVASSWGGTAVRATEICEGMKVIAVGHVTGHHIQNVQPFKEENRQKVESKGGIVLIGREAFDPLNDEDHDDHVANALRIFGQGAKVACEISVMAADAGLVRIDEDIIAVGGRHGGADTALVIKPANSNSVFELRVREILCRPYSTSVRVESKFCIGCNKCVEACRYDVFEPSQENGDPPIVMHSAKCAICYDCLKACESGAIVMEHGLKPKNPPGFEPSQS